MKEILFNIGVFLVAGSVIYFFGGLLIEATADIARRLHRDGFIVAFVLLGILTSLSELSVAFNATIEGVPQISAGNLLGASFVIFLLIVPILAIFGNGIKLQHTLTKRRLLLALLVIAAPALIVLDGTLSALDGVIMLVLYAVLVKYSPTKQRIKEVHHQLVKISLMRKDLIMDFLKIVVGAILIFFSGRLMVEEALYFSALLSVPSSFIGLLVISLGTNMPELVIAVRSIRKQRKAIAFGDYVGSAAFNTFIMGVLCIVNGTFFIAPQQFIVTSCFLIAGLVIFYIFSCSKNTISRIEGALLGLIYVVFVVLQLLAASG
jgi:cation:H+ antiporter